MGNDEGEGRDGFDDDLAVGAGAKKVQSKVRGNISWPDR